MASRKRKLDDPVRHYSYPVGGEEYNESESDIEAGESDDSEGEASGSSYSIEEAPLSPIRAFPCSSNDSLAVDVGIGDDVCGQVEPSDAQVTSSSAPEVDMNPESPVLLFHHMGMSAVDYFFLFYPRSIFKVTASETNKYADWMLRSGEVTLSSGSNLHKWTMTNTGEIQAFTALQIAMGLVTKPGLSQYWETDWLIATPGFSTVMARHRFEMLNTFLHFSSNVEELEPGEASDPYFQVRPIIDASVPTFLKYFRPGNSVSSTDAVANSFSFKGRVFLRKYIPTKSQRKYQIFRVVQDSHSGFCLAWDPHTTGDKEQKSQSSTQPEPAGTSSGPKRRKPAYTEFAWKYVTNSNVLYQQDSRFHYPGRDVKSYMIVYHFAIEVALENAYIAYKLASSNNKMTMRKFRLEVIDGLLSGYEWPTKYTGRRSNTRDIPSDARLTGRHFMAKYEREKFRPDCIVCSDRARRIRKQTRFYCKQCGVPMCIMPCFERYHTLKNYKE